MATRRRVPFPDIYRYRSLPEDTPEYEYIEEEVPTYDETISRSISSVSLAINPNANTASNLNTIPHSNANPNSIPLSGTNSQPMSRTNSSAESSSPGTRRASLKELGLNFLNAKQHLALASCRDIVLLPPLYHAAICLKKALWNEQTTNEILLSDLVMPGSAEHFIAGIWCLVAGYLSYAVVEGLMVRWIVTYQTTAAIVRVLSLSLLLITMEQATLAIFSPDGLYSLHTWILISCILTGCYILQNFVTSNLDLKNEKRTRSVDYYNITVYAVVPVGLASFVTMVGLLRALFILRVDLDRGDINELFGGIN